MTVFAIIDLVHVVPVLWVLLVALGTPVPFVAGFGVLAGGLWLLRRGGAAPAVPDGGDR